MEQPWPLQESWDDALQTGLVWLISGTCSS